MLSKRRHRRCLERIDRLELELELGLREPRTRDVPTVAALLRELSGPMQQQLAVRATLIEVQPGAPIPTLEPASGGPRIIAPRGALLTPPG